MRQLTPQEREALMADMNSFFDESFIDETLSDEDIVDDEHWNLGHGWSGD